MTTKTDGAVSQDTLKRLVNTLDRRDLPLVVTYNTTDQRWTAKAGATVISGSTMDVALEGLLVDLGG